ncbi:MAG: hypothetical protein J6Y36_02260 [Treponema sp.]|nr:hypothetical protein [Treponema sp.]
MGNGVVLRCKDCNEKENLILGCGFGSFMNRMMNVVYVCDSCGYWKEGEVEFEIPEDAEDNLESVITAKEDTKEEMCPNCKKAMKRYEKFYNEKGNAQILKMTCRKCGGILNAEGKFCWD